MNTFSDYVQKLSPDAKTRYLEKIKFINNTDPYVLLQSDFEKDYRSLPTIGRKSIIDYLIFKASWETQNEMRAYKSMDAFMQVACNWVKKVFFKKFDEVFLLLGSVLHSQKLNVPPLKPWIIMAKTGEILSGHCDCVAGLGEVCTHVAAILFAVEKLSENAESVTDIFAYWKKPVGKPSVHKSIKDINWAISEEKSEKVPSSTQLQDIPEMGREEIVDFLKKFEEAGQSSVLHNVLGEFLSDETGSPGKIINLFSAKYERLSLPELLVIGGDLNLNISSSISSDIEEKTRLQAKSSNWFMYRAGRITASKFKAACRTKIDSPSLSLIKNICYPHIYKRVYKQMEYGCIHEKDALECYISLHKSQHPNVEMKKVGLVINPEFPMFGASPDSLVMCSECGEGCVEVKCPYCIKDSEISDLIEKKQSCLKITDGKMHLDRQHAYYYQTQMQIFVTKTSFCDFVVWNNKEVFVEKVVPDIDFWMEEKQKALNFFNKCILPEILGKYFTKSQPLIHDNQPSTSKVTSS